ncbi:hypothetical protein DFH06DRAFT_1142784 [Mycena polygramma]|nr:hypothetical protein DFH06DRAFT_1142784 [Mycena polygramma]
MDNICVIHRTPYVATANVQLFAEVWRATTPLTLPGDDASQKSQNPSIATNHAAKSPSLYDFRKTARLPSHSRTQSGKHPRPTQSRLVDSSRLRRELKALTRAKSATATVSAFIGERKRKRAGDEAEGRRREQREGEKGEEGHVQEVDRRGGEEEERTCEWGSHTQTWEVGLSGGRMRWIDRGREKGKATMKEEKEEKERRVDCGRGGGAGRFVVGGARSVATLIIERGARSIRTVRICERSLHSRSTRNRGALAIHKKDWPSPSHSASIRLRKRTYASLPSRGHTSSAILPFPIPALGPLASDKHTH